MTHPIYVEDLGSFSDEANDAITISSETRSEESSDDTSMDGFIVMDNSPLPSQSTVNPDTIIRVHLSFLELSDVKKSYIYSCVTYARVNSPVELPITFYSALIDVFEKELEKTRD